MRKLPFVLAIIIVASVSVFLIEGCQKSFSQSSDSTANNTVIIQVPVDITVTTYTAKKDSITGQTVQIPSTQKMTSFNFYSYNLDTDIKTAIPVAIPQNFVIYGVGASVTRNGNILFKGWDYTSSKEVWYSYTSKTNAVRIVPVPSNSVAVGTY